MTVRKPKPFPDATGLPPAAEHPCSPCTHGLNPPDPYLLPPVGSRPPAPAVPFCPRTPLSPLHPRSPPADPHSFSRVPWPGSAPATCGLSCRASSRRSLSTAGILALRRGWVQGGRAPGLAAASLPTEAAAAVRPQAAGHGGWLRWRGRSRSRSLLPVPVRGRKRVTGQGWQGAASCRH